MLTIGDNCYVLHVQGHPYNEKPVEIFLPVSSILFIQWDRDKEDSNYPDRCYLFLPGAEYGLKVVSQEVIPLYSLIRWGHP